MRGSIIAGHGTCEFELTFDDRGQHLTRAVEIVVRDHVAEPVRLFELVPCQLDPLADFPCGLRRALAQPALELGHVGGDENRDARRHLLLDGQCTLQLELEHAHPAVARDAVDFGAERAVTLAGDVLDVLEKRTLDNPPRELVVAEEPVLPAVDLPGPLATRRRRDGDLQDGDARGELADQRSLARAGRPGDDEHHLFSRRHASGKLMNSPRRVSCSPFSRSEKGHHYRLKRDTSSARCRSDNPPTVFDWLMRQLFSRRAALTRPSLGTAMSMSNTFAVSTHSGGSSRISSICARPSFRSFFSWARRTRMSFARLRASMR